MYMLHIHLSKVTNATSIAVLATLWTHDMEIWFSQTLYNSMLDANDSLTIPVVLMTIVLISTGN